ncbi:transglutaminase family protein [Roseivivax marinus]|uniref:transglutaminase family protein n=1 Tax=Roseivivax marinus TaxID=1379903 RepID=UPI001F039477|nr:transglutaminase family protein [Roseivivax marinus]UMA66416.1 transglutaminase family protein [Roseivivax marinus]
MRYDLTLEIGYDYGAPAPSARCVLRVAPRRIAGEQRVEAERLRVTPEPGEIAYRTDFFGNSVTEMGFTDPLQVVTVRLSARIERLARPPQLDLTPRLDRLAAEIGTRRALGPESPDHFVSASPRIGYEPAIAAFAHALIGPQMTALGAVQTIGQALHTHMTFDAEATDVDTEPGHAFAEGRGVCQDFSHVMIAGLRAVGVPAGYVSGFLRTEPPAGQPRLAGADAMHAWVRAWCGAETGWIDYDPTNHMMVGTDHIVVAVGRDYSDVAPVKGAVRSAGVQASHHSVDLVPLGE